MDDRVLLVAVVFVIAFLAGLSCGVWWHKGLGKPAEASAPTERRAPAVDRSTADAVRIGELEAEVQRLRRDLEARTEEDARVGLVWPPDRPAQFTPTGFRGAFDTALQACEPAVVVTGYDCLEPPCIAKLRVENGWHAALVGCLEFQERFGASVDLATFAIDCPDGVPERVALLAPIDGPWVGTLDEAAYQVRLGQRWAAIREAWICGMP
jgi:hypothetical protein